MSAERLGRITRVMQDAARDRQTAGTVTLVVRDGQVVYFEAAGNADLEKNAPMRTDTIFRIASMTKAVVSVGVMMLVEEGRISLTDPVSKFIPAFAKTTVLASDGGRVAVVPARRPITIRDLLTHTAGISYGQGALEPCYTPAGFDQWYFADRAQNMSAWMDKLATLPFESQPGERWVYGYNTDVLGNVIERVTGQTLAAFLGERVDHPAQDGGHGVLRARRQSLAIRRGVRGGRRREDRAGPRRAFGPGSSTRAARKWRSRAAPA